jgi:hypothetical protein
MVLQILFSLNNFVVLQNNIMSAFIAFLQLTRQEYTQVRMKDLQSQTNCEKCVKKNVICFWVLLG